MDTFVRIEGKYKNVSKKRMCKWSIGYCLLYCYCPSPK